MDTFHEELLKNLERAKAKRNLRFKQRLMNVRSAVFPGMLALIAGKTLANIFYPAASQTAQWVYLSYGTAILLSLPLYQLLNRKRDRAFARQRLFMMDALEATLKAHGGSHDSD